VEQRLLPFLFEIMSSAKPEDVALAIETMQIRGAPSIGAAAAFGLALAYRVDRPHFESRWLPRFRATRPTAVNLFHACDTMQALSEQGVAENEMLEAAQTYADDEVTHNQAIGAVLAEKLAVGKRRILTHCNAGWLAAVDWGTALSGIYHLARSGEKPFVWVDETRPRLQGARLTAWELGQEGVECSIQADAAAAWRMARGEVEAIVVGADRIAANGDVANKIGTYMLALAASHHGIPFYVAAPGSTFDAHCQCGGDIPIEERSGTEIMEVDGPDQHGKQMRIRITADAPVSNPAFDITPAALITGIINEKGLWNR
jgi:methylthioribose-1-phosphate isomerase